jgi:uncharacterized protein YdbL (DUF1318 family)
MKRHTQKLFAATLFVIFFICACVTINIYFPAEKVESVAGKIVHDIRGEKEEKETKPKGDKQSALSILIAQMLSPSTAYAQEAIDVSNPTIRGLKEKMKARYPAMKPYYQNGILKEGNDGYAGISKTDGLGLKKKRDIKALVDAENKDRRQLYQEVAKAMSIDPNQLNQVAEIFAKEWQKSVK